MKLIEIAKHESSKKVKLVGKFQRENDPSPKEIWFEYPIEFSSFLSLDVDTFVPLLLIDNMTRGESLELKSPVSAQLISNIQTLQNIFSTCFPNELFLVKVKFPSTVIRPALKSPATAAFFSGGVDSFYTLEKSWRNDATYSPQLSHLIAMIGFEVTLEQQKEASQLEGYFYEIARLYQKTVIIGKTNLRDVIPADWGRFLHAPALASIALSLSNKFSQVLIPSSKSYDREGNIGWGSHPLIDSFWSTEKMHMFNDGPEVNRVKKTAYIAEDHQSLDYLRVCSLGTLYNCGKCQKCLRTMTSLKAIDKLKDSTTFPHDFSYKLLNALYIEDTGEKHYLEHNLKLAKEVNKDPAFILAIQKRLERAKYRKALRDLCSHPYLSWIMTLRNQVLKIIR